MDETDQGQQHASPQANTAGNGSKQPSDEEQQSSSEIIVERSAQPSARKFTGPRTEQGKNNSKHNALRHGIFSEVTVLVGESKNDYESLLGGLSEALQPENSLENLLVEKLAMLAWRHRRLLKAEGAEIRHGSEFLEWDQKMKQQREAEIAKRTLLRIQFADEPGLVPEIQNPEILDYCVELLVELKGLINSRGFDEKYDRSVLEIIYGAHSTLHGTLRNRYSIFFNTSQASKEERKLKGYLTPEKCKVKVMSEIDDEIQRFRNYRQERASMEAERTKLEILRRNVPESEKLDRLLRYETSLERAFDRTLTQLERAQRMRKGQPLLPQLEIKHS